ncbi:hypothetical protein BDB00DRAFT_793062 [Zychaea mexicana]|uniref:uncharacterized protein n=1 Tax=Zychaea mexicana TaxID=64656 RepID=UPI0022FF155E|nr:uncharacterized protein BDB00DRAFT_793062 [Zychaea mexicana]KAI9482561.1 hypothetical protein BDB00DRAFT_793062 [Zychaea mexicana]
MSPNIRQKRIRQFDIEYCKSCPDYGLPLVLMRSHKVPLTPKAPGHAVHIKLMQTIHNLHYICRVSVHNIAKWLQADFEQEVPASLKSRLNDALPIFGRILLSLKKQLRKEFGVENNVCPGCRYVVL